MCKCLAFNEVADEVVMLDVKELVREHDKLNNFCGCRINIETDVHSSGCSIWFTVPKYR